MAITLADFTKIWASTSPLTPYSFGDANYQEGWNFIGSTPPSRQMWDSLQKQNDEKLKYIVDNYLSTAGGTMTGAIQYDGENDEVFKLSPSSATTIDFGWDFANNNGALIGLHSNSDTHSGEFEIFARNENNSKSLIGKPNGDLTWDSKRVAVQGGLVNGHGILTGSVSDISVSANGYTTGSVSFGQTYSSAPIVVAN